MMIASPRARELVEHAIKLGEDWRRQIPAGAFIEADDVVPAGRAAGDLAIGASPGASVEISAGSSICLYTESGGEITLIGDVALTASEAGIEISPALERLVDVAIEVARHFTLAPEPAHRARAKIRDLRDALVALGCLTEEVSHG